MIVSMSGLANLKCADDLTIVEHIKSFNAPATYLKPETYRCLLACYSARQAPSYHDNPVDVRFKSRPHEDTDTRVKYYTFRTLIDSGAITPSCRNIWQIYVASSILLKVLRQLPWQMVLK